MLCSLKTKRPDKILERRLLFLSYSLVLLTAAVILYLLYPAYSPYLICLIFFISAFSLISTIKTLKAGEEAISYGGFANEIIKDEQRIRRIDNAAFEAVIENGAARDFFKEEAVMDFLEKHLSDNRQNKAAFGRLQTALENLSREQVTLSLSLNRTPGRIFDREDWFEVAVRPIYLKKTDIFEGPYSIKAIKKDTYFYWTVKDVTAARNMDQVFQEERRGLHDFLDYLPAGLYICAKDYRIEYCNHALAGILGRSREEITGRSLKDFLATNSTLPPLHSSSWNGSLYIVDAAGQPKKCFAAQENFRDNSEIKSRGVLISNLPEEGSLQNRLEEDENRISSLFEFSPVGILLCDRDGRIIDSNNSAALFMNSDRKRLNGRSLSEFVKNDETTHFAKAFAQVANAQEDFATADVRLDLGNNGERVAMMYISPLRRRHAASLAEIDGCVIYMIDATARKNLEMQFAQAQKMQAMGQLAGGVAHDFNNLLTAMIGFCDLLLQRHGVGDPSFTDIIQIKQNANRAAGLVRQLLAFSRKQPLKPKLIEVTENFVELSHMLKRILGEQITLNFHHGSELGYIRVDPVQFSQVIINLAVNAKDAMNNHGTLSIATRTETLLEPYQFGADTIKPGEFVVIEVSDTGCGIPIENLTRIFEPFFSTKQNVVGSGTGLGLAMVYGIVRQTEGFIKVSSIIGKGTTFAIYLPRFEKEEEAAENAQPKAREVLTDREGSPVLTVNEKINSPVAMNQKLIFGLNVSSIDRSHETGGAVEDIRILFVEDEDSVRAFAVRALKKKGYDVVGCNSAENALEHLEKDTNFNLMITDMVMPGINGAELAGIVREKIPGIKIILASGYSEEIARRELAGSDDFAFIAKPFSLGDLTKKVFDVLNSKE